MSNSWLSSCEQHQTLDELKQIPQLAWRQKVDVQIVLLSSLHLVTSQALLLWLSFHIQGARYRTCYLIFGANYNPSGLSACFTQKHLAWYGQVGRQVPIAAEEVPPEASC